MNGRTFSPLQELDSYREGLTSKEQEVLEQALKGLSHEGTAAVLKMAVSTVKVHMGRILMTYEVNSRVELLALYLNATQVELASYRSAASA